MQSLEYDNLKKEYEEEMKEIREKIEGEVVGLPFRILEDYKRSAVNLVIEGDKPEAFLITLKGARDLALALRQAANKVEKHNLTDLRQGIKKSKKS